MDLLLIRKWETSSKMFVFFPWKTPRVPKAISPLPQKTSPGKEKLFFHDCWIFCGLISHGHSSTSQMSDAKRCVRSRGSWRLGTSKAKRDMRTAKRGITRGWLYCWTQQWFYSKKVRYVFGKCRTAEPYWFPGAQQWKLQGGSVKHQKLVVLCSMIGRGYPLRIIKIQGSCCCREQDKKDSSCFLIMMSIAYIGLGSLMDPWHRSTNWHAYGQYVGMI